MPVQLFSVCFGSMAISFVLSLQIAFSQTPHRVFSRSLFWKTQERVVKIYGAGGLKGLEAYQTGALISPEGYVLTADSLVLDQGEVVVVRSEGDRYSGKVVGADPTTRVAVVKIEGDGDPFPHFDLDASLQAEGGEPVLVFANIFGIASGDEPVTVQRGYVSTLAPAEAVLPTPTLLKGANLYLFDLVTSNPGSAGGVVTNYRGQLLGMVGNESRNRITGGWLNYAAPLAALAPSVGRILGGQPLTTVEEPKATTRLPLLPAWGFQLVENIVVRTPPFVEYVAPGSQANKAGLAPDDLIVMVDGRVAATGIQVRHLLAERTPGKPVTLLVKRGETLLEITLPVSPPTEASEGTP